MIRNSTGTQPAGPPLAAMLFQPREGAAAPQPKTLPVIAPAERPADGKGHAGLLSPVQIEMLDGLDVLVLRGNTQDVEQVMEIINQIERLSAETKPAIELLPLRNVDCQAMADLVQQLYDEVFLSRQGDVSITPIVKPNAMLIVGRPENVRTVKDLVERLDQPVDPNTQFQVFRLKYASAVTAQGTIQQFYQNPAQLGTVVHVTADARSNALIVQASPRDMAEVADLIHRIDTATSAAVNEVRIIQLKHSSAQDLAAILHAGDRRRDRQPRRPAGPALHAGAADPARRASRTSSRATSARPCSASLPSTPRSGSCLNSGILSDVHITADVRSNAVVVSAPPENLDLLEALIRQLDDLPAAEAADQGVHDRQRRRQEPVVHAGCALLTASRAGRGGNRRRCRRRPRAPGTRWCPCDSPSTRAPTASSPSGRRPI